MNLRDDFPFFKNNKLIYLDSAATTQKPQILIDALSNFYTQYNAPVHRGIYPLAEEVTTLYEGARSIVARYIGAFDDEVVFPSGATEGINFIATAWAEQVLVEGDEVIITELEHHSNSLPWIRLEKTKGIVLKYIPITSQGILDYDVYETLVTKKTKLVACTHTSNALGSRTDLPRIIKHARAYGARVLIDATQAAGRERLKVHELNADFLVFSAHKMAGPTGLGVLYIARHMQPEVAPYQVGGGMVYSVGLHEATWVKPPLRYEAGTPPIAQVYAFGEVIRYLETISFDQLKKYEAALCAQLIDGLKKIPSITILGPVDELASEGHLVSFISKKGHPHDIAAYLATKEICVRAGNHCTQPLHKKLGIEGSLRASFYLYNTETDVRVLVEALKLIA